MCCLALGRLGALVVMDRLGAVLGRSWPLFDLFLLLRHSGQAAVSAVLPGDLSMAEMSSLKAKCLAVDISRGESSNAQDKTFALSEVLKRHLPFDPCSFGSTVTSIDTKSP